MLLSEYSPSGNAAATKKTSFQVGANANETIKLALGGLSTNLALNNFNLVDSQRSGLGAFINRLEYTIEI